MKKKNKFRLRGKKLFLTYPQLDKSIEFVKEKTLEQLKEKLKFMRSYVIGEEKHEDGGIHLHCFLELSISLDTYNVNFFDLIFDNKIQYHGNYQIGKRKNEIIAYIIKDGNFITNLKLPYKNEKLLKPTEHLYDICLKEGYYKAKEELIKNYPELAVQRGSAILKNLNIISEFIIEKESHEINKEDVFDLEDYDKIEPENLTKILNWYKEGFSQGFKKTLIIHGPSGTGKTELARTIFNELGINYLDISEINDFRKYDSYKHKGILIDYLDVESLTKSNKLNIVDTSYGKSIKVLYGTVTPKPFIPRIITTNSLFDFTKNLTKELLLKVEDIYLPKKISSKFKIKY